MITTNQRATLERMVLVSAGIYFDDEKGTFVLMSNFNHQELAEVHPQTVCSLIKGKYIKSGERTASSFQLTSKGLTEAKK